MHTRTIAAWIGTAVLVIIAIALAIYSVQLNFRYAVWTFGAQGLAAPMVFAFGVAAADVGKLILPWVISRQWRRKRHLAATGTSILMIGLAAASIWAMVSLGLQGRESVAGAARVRTDQISDLKTQRATLSAQLAVYGSITAPDVIRRRMQAMEFDRRWTSTAGCTNATATASRKFCAEHGRMFSQLAGATKAAALRSGISVLNARIDEARTSGRVETPYAAQAILAKLIGTESDAIGGVTLLTLAVLIEILALVMSAVAIEQVRRLIDRPATVPETKTVSRLNDADDYSNITDPDGPLDCSDDVLRKPSLSTCPQISNVTPLRHDIPGPEGSLTRPGTDTVNKAPTIPPHGRRTATISGTVGSLAVATDQALEGPSETVPAIVPGARPTLVPADPCPVAFWDANVMPARNGRLGSSNFYEAYQEWCRARDVEPLSQTAVTRRIKAARKVHDRKSCGLKVFVGARLR